VDHGNIVNIRSVNPTDAGAKSCRRIGLFGVPSLSGVQAWCCFRMRSDVYDDFHRTQQLPAVIIDQRPNPLPNYKKNPQKKAKP
jgi:hypothetical protein